MSLWNICNWWKRISEREKKLYMYTFVCVTVSQSCPTLFATPWTVDCQAPLSMEFSRQEVGSCSLLLGIFPTQGLNPGLPHYRQILYHLSHQGSPYIYIYIYVGLIFCHQGMWCFSSLTRDRIWNACIGSRESSFKLYLFRLGWVLFVAYGIFTALLSCPTHVGSSALTRDQSWAPCLGRAES